MTREEREKAIDALKISAPVTAVTQEEFNDYIQTLNKIMDWLQQEPCEDAISRQAAIYVINHAEVNFSVESEIDFTKHKREVHEIIENVLGAQEKALKELPPVTAEKVGQWIPLTKRPMTDEEREYYREWSDIDGAMIFDCPLPEDGQEVLVSYGGYVMVDTFCKDDGCYFEGVDIDDVEAWMPLPEPYKASPTDGEVEE